MSSEHFLLIKRNNQQETKKRVRSAVLILKN